MTRIVVEVKEVALADAFDLTVPVARAMTAPPPGLDIGLVELNEISGTTQWTTGPVPPIVPGAAIGDMYLGVDGSVWQWDGDSWTDTGTNISSSDTPEEMLAKIITVDGAGSTLDADLLDGHDSPYFATDADLGTVETAVTTLQTRVTNVENTNTSQDTAINLKAPIDSPTFTGNPTAPTPTAGDNDTSIATTAFVKAVTGSIVSFPEAPSDANAYGRKAAAWVDVAEEAPNDGITYGRKNGAWVASVGGASISDGPPPGPITQGQLWWESDSGNTYVYYDDGNSQQWVQISGGPGVALCWVSDTPPPQPVNGMLWWRADRGLQYTYVDDGNSQQWVQSIPSTVGQVKTAEARNRIVNGAMQISQENGNTAGTAVAYYPADQWYSTFSSSSTITVARAVPPLQPQGSINIVASPLETAAAAAEYIALATKLEGNALSDFLFGTATSMQAVIAFTVYLPTAGTYWVSLTNSAATHTWLGSYTISAAEVSTWVRKTIVIPAGAINAGTWPTDNTLGAYLRFCFHCGATYTGVAGWQSGNFFAGPGQALGLSVGSCYLTNVALHLDPGNTGVAPDFVTPDYADELRRCQRYYEKIDGVAIYGYQVANDYILNSYSFKAPKRTTPTMAAPGWTSTANATNQAMVDTTENTTTFQAMAVATGRFFFRGLYTNANARM